MRSKNTLDYIHKRAGKKYASEINVRSLTYFDKIFEVMRSDDS